MMPPAGARRPDRKALDAFAGAVEDALDRAAAANPNPGRTPLHRMNRGEYANAIRDLLGGRCGPCHAAARRRFQHGFDNIADVLGVSPALLERYVSAAAKISRLAVGDPETAPLDVTYTVKGDLIANRNSRRPAARHARRHRDPAQLPAGWRISDQAVVARSSASARYSVKAPKARNWKSPSNGERVKLYKLDEVPMFFMRESPGSRAASNAARSIRWKSA